MSFESIQLVRVPLREELAVGEFYIRHGEGGKVYLVVHLPGQGQGTTWPLKKVADVAGPVSGSGHGPWNWDGDEDQPTIKPSLWHIGVWHGFIEKGFARSVGHA